MVSTLSLEIAMFECLNAYPAFSVSNLFGSCEGATIHGYQACVKHHDLQRAVGVLERMLQERVRPDARCYSLLLRACVEGGQPKEALFAKRSFWVCWGGAGGRFPDRIL